MTATIPYSNDSVNEKDFDQHRNLDSSFEHPEKDTIEIDPDDITNNFTIIPNELLRNENLTPQCRWFICYLLSNNKNWKIRVDQVQKHLSSHRGYGDAGVYKLFKEAIRYGYMKRIDIFHKHENGKIKGKISKYLISSTPKYLISEVSNSETSEREISQTETIKNTKTKEYQKREENNIPPLKVPMEPIAPDGASPPPASSEKRKKNSFLPSEEAKELAEEMAKELEKASDQYRRPSSLTNMAIEIQTMITKEAREVKTIFDVFCWALHDSFWKDKLFKPNPAKYLRDKFMQLHAKMTAPKPQEKRRFAPSSNSAEALKTLQRMNATAL